MSTADRAFGRVLDRFAALAALVLLAMALTVCADVVLRNVGAAGLPWSNEASEYGLYFATVAAAPWLLRQGQHVRVDILTGALPLRAGRALEWAADGVGLLVCLTMAWYGSANVVDSLRQGSMLIKTLVIPEWWLLAPLPVAFALLSVEFVFRMVRLAAGRRGPRQEAGSIV